MLNKIAQKCIKISEFLNHWNTKKALTARNCEDSYFYLGININVYVTPIMEFTLLGLSSEVILCIALKQRKFTDFEIVLNYFFSLIAAWAAASLAIGSLLSYSAILFSSIRVYRISIIPFFYIHNSPSLFFVHNDCLQSFLIVVTAKHPDFTADEANVLQRYKTFSYKSSLLLYYHTVL